MYPQTPVPQDSRPKEDNRLVGRAAEGERPALIRIMQQHNQKLFRLAFAIVADRSEAEDVLQEAYIRAFGRLHEYSGEGPLGGWLASIVRHEAIDRWRGGKRRKAREALEADMSSRLSSEDLPLNRAQADDAMFNPAIDAERNDLRNLLEAEIARLPDQFREVFIMREVEGLSVDEAAEYLGIPEATVKSRDFRARALLRARLGEHIDAHLPQTFTFLNQDCSSLIERVLRRLGH